MSSGGTWFNGTIDGKTTIGRLYARMRANQQLGEKETEMDDTLWALAKELRNERCETIEQTPLPEAADTTQSLQVRRLMVTAFVAVALVIFHMAIG
jgi:hypothetical protein